MLAIGGLDPSGGAGLLADADAIAESGGRAQAVATAITVQSRRGVAGATVLAPRLILAQVERLFADEPPAAVKLGMLGNAAVAKALALQLKGLLDGRPLVIDPVVRSTSGAQLFAGRPNDYRALFALASAVTPNLPEAEWLLGRPVGPHRPDRETAARALGARAVVLKGGHASGARAEDLVWQAEQPSVWLSAPRLATPRRGTGCRFASALATRLALGDDLRKSAQAAKRLVLRYLRES